MSRRPLPNLGRANLGALDTRFVAFLVRNVAKRCTLMILGRTLKSSVFGKDIRDINDYRGYVPKAIADSGARFLED